MMTKFYLLCLIYFLQISNQLYAKIELLPHQLLPINYLAEKPLKGLLIHHKNGTGKTIVAIGFSEKFKDKKVVVVMPKFLKRHWQEQLKIYGIQNEKRFYFFGFDETKELLSKDFKGAIWVVEESHKWVELLNSSIPSMRKDATALFAKIRREAFKILSLTGTPLYSDPVNLAYQINLVSGEDLLPYNKEQFRTQFMKINAWRSFWRGYLLESSFFTTALSAIGVGLTISFSIPGAFIIPMLTAPLLIELTKKEYSSVFYPLSSFDPKKLEPLLSTYVSYYGFDEKNAPSFPEVNLTVRNVKYNWAQYEFLYDFFDSALESERLKTLFLDHDEINAHEISMNSSLVQEQLKAQIGSGREIGNLSFLHEGKIIFPEKFEEIKKIIEKNPGPIVIYSHYYKNGTKLIKEYFEHEKMKASMAILLPEDSFSTQKNIVEQYNQGKISILLIHSEVVEGFTLKGTRQLHFLEPSYNKSFQNQIISRVASDTSHVLLPEKDRRVSVFVWKQEITAVDFNSHIALRHNWHKIHPEFNFYSAFGSMRSDMDRSTEMKVLSPDCLSYERSNILEKNLRELNELLSEVSIEKQVVKDPVIPIM